MWQMLTSVLTLALLSSTWACTTEQSQASTYTSKFCGADVVFKGTPSSGSSSIANNPDGTQVTTYTMNFNVEQSYKGASGGKTASVLRQYTTGDPCDSNSFSEMADHYLVFAKGSPLKVETCSYSFPWECVPESIKNQLPLTC